MSLKSVITIIILAFICGNYFNEYTHPQIIKNVCQYSEQQIKNQRLIIEEQRNISRHFPDVSKENINGPFNETLNIKINNRRPRQ
jgi:hypothetical protein